METIMFKGPYETYEFKGKVLISSNHRGLEDRYYVTDKGDLVITQILNGQDWAFHHFKKEDMDKRYGVKGFFKSDTLSFVKSEVGVFWGGNDALIQALKQLGYDYIKRI